MAATLATPIKILFLGSPLVALNSLMRLQQSALYQVEGVVCSAAPGTEVRQYCRTQPIKLYEPCVLKNLTKLPKADGAIVVAFGHLLRQEVLDFFNNKILNVHFSLLPCLRGAAPVERALMQGLLQTGVSLQQLQLQLDSGPVIGSKALALTKNTTAKEVFTKLTQMGTELLLDEGVRFFRGKLLGKKQNHAQATYAPKIQKHEHQIHWHKPASTIHNQVRALTARGGAFFIHKNKRFKVFATLPSKMPSEASNEVSGAYPQTPGQVLESKAQLVVACAKNTKIQILKIQKEGKKALTAKEFLKASPFAKGESLKGDSLAKEGCLA